MMTGQPPKDTLFAAIGVTLLFIGVPVSLVLGIWLDARWFPMAFLMVFAAIACGSLSIAIDKKLAERWRHRK